MSNLIKIFPSLSLTIFLFLEPWFFLYKEGKAMKLKLLNQSKNIEGILHFFNNVDIKDGLFCLVKIRDQSQNLKLTNILQVVCQEYAIQIFSYIRLQNHNVFKTHVYN